MNERDAFMLLIGFNIGAIVSHAVAAIVFALSSYRLFMKGKLL